MDNTLIEISIRFVKIGLPIIALVSFIGNPLSMIVFGRYKMRKHSCCLYFFALSTNNLIYSTTILIVSLLNDGYQIAVVVHLSILCKFFIYFDHVLSALSPYFIILASIDRWCASSTNIR